MTEAGRLRFGTVARPHGVRGAIRVHFENPQSALLEPGLVVHLEKHGDYEIHSFFGGDRVRFVGVDSREKAEALRGAPIFVNRADFPPPEDDEVYLVDMVGAEVYLEDGTKVGKIMRFDTNGAQDIADIKTASGTVAMPFIPQFLVEVLPEEKRVVVAPPDGLLQGDPVVAKSEDGA